MRIFLENILNSFESIRANKLRSTLSMLGIIIGVSSVIILNSLGVGAERASVSQIEKLGMSNIEITPASAGINEKTFRSDILNEEIIEILEENISDIKGVLPTISSGFATFINGDKNANGMVLGVPSNFFEVRELEVDMGSAISEENIKNLDKVIILGKYVAEDLFEVGENPIGKRIKYGNSFYEVKGILTADSDLTYNAIIPISTASVRALGQKHYSNIKVYLNNMDQISEKESEVDQLLKNYFGIKNDGVKPYELTNPSYMLDSIKQITSIITALLSGIAGISLLVGGIGVMNIMLVSVTERTKEIGIRKAIGARGKDIMSQFLIESSLLSLIGGGIGILVSYGGASLIGMFIEELTPVVTKDAIIMSFCFSLFIGIFFGAFPAYKASKLRPIEALRFE